VRPLLAAAVLLAACLSVAPATAAPKPAPSKFCFPCGAIYNSSASDTGVIASSKYPPYSSGSVWKTIAPGRNSPSVMGDVNAMYIPSGCTGIRQESGARYGSGWRSLANVSYHMTIIC
jgi:hypothetical protein